jgi:predicted PurR-regulated permease PerM
VLTLAGFALADQFVNLVNIVQEYFAGLPQLLQGLTEHDLQLGPFQVDFAELERMLVDEFGLDFASLGQQLLSTIQPAIGQAGSFLGALATSTITTVGWILFVFIITFLILSDAGRAPDFFQGADLPGHDADLRRLGRELARIWNAFLRGQLMLVGIIILASFVLMSILGVRYALALALITGLAKFVPYIGSFAMYVTTALVSFFQVGNYLGIEPGMTYMLVATLPAILMDMTFDNVITPRFYGKTLGVHPAAVLVTALVAANLLGFVGLLLAAPVLASLQLFATYVFRKMVDLNPWPQVEEMKVKPEVPLARRVQRWWAEAQKTIKRQFKPRKARKKR